MYAERDRRRRLVLEFISSKKVSRQEELVAMLKANGVAATQATLSRDLRDLSIHKGISGYMIPAGGMPPPAPGSAPLEPAMKQYLLGVGVSGTTVVCQTRPGQAMPLATEVDRVKPNGVVGTLAGDDTVFVAVESPGKARAIARTFKSMAGL